MSLLLEALAVLHQCFRYLGQPVVGQPKVLQLVQESQSLRKHRQLVYAYVSERILRTSRFREDMFFQCYSVRDYSDLMLFWDRKRALR